MTGRKAGDHGAQETVSSAHDADRNDWSGLSAQDLIFRHQQRPLLSERERNHRGRPAFYEAAAGRDLCLLSSRAAVSSLNSRKLGFTMYTPASNAAFNAGPELSRTNRAPACLVV